MTKTADSTEPAGFGADLLANLRSRGVAVRLEGGSVKLDAPKGVVSLDDIVAMRTHKAEIVALLSHPPNAWMGCQRLDCKGGWARSKQGYSVWSCPGCGYNRLAQINVGAGAA